jgi:Flp pilus assembly protein TadD
MRALLLAVGCLVAVPHAAFADNDADAHYKQGLAYKNEGKTDDAIRSLEAAVAKNPKHGMAWSSLGNLYKQKKDIAKAVDAYEHAVAVITKDKILWGNLGMAYYRNNQIDKALSALTTASKLDPNDAEVRANLGTVRRQKGDNAGAIVDLEAAVKLAPKEANYANNLGVAYRFAKRDDDAIKAFEKAIELSPNDPQFHFNLAVAFRRKTKDNPDLITKAITEYERATSLDPGNTDGWFDLGFMYKENHDNDKAIEAFRHYICLNKAKGGKMDAEADKRVHDEMDALGGGGKAPPKGKTPAKKDECGDIGAPSDTKKPKK